MKTKIWCVGMLIATDPVDISSLRFSRVGIFHMLSEFVGTELFLVFFYCI